jgi:hypothetical protein
MSNNEDSDFVSEEKVRTLIKKLMFEVEKLRDENESLWFMLEEIEQSTIDGRAAITDSLKLLKEYRIAMSQKPAEA